MSSTCVCCILSGYSSSCNFIWFPTSPPILTSDPGHHQGLFRHNWMLIGHVLCWDSHPLISAWPVRHLYCEAGVQVRLCRLLAPWTWTLWDRPLWQEAVVHQDQKLPLQKQLLSICKTSSQPPKLYLCNLLGNKRGSDSDSSPKNVSVTWNTKFDRKHLYDQLMAHILPRETTDSRGSVTERPLMPSSLFLVLLLTSLSLPSGAFKDEL